MDSDSIYYQTLFFWSACKNNSEYQLGIRVLDLAQSSIIYLGSRHKGLLFPSEWVCFYIDARAYDKKSWGTRGIQSMDSESIYLTESKANVLILLLYENSSIFITG